MTPVVIEKNMSQTLSQIKAMLAAHGLRPKHRLGQHFLHDSHHMARIVEAAEIGEGDLVLEIGPGTGGLTLRLLAAGARLVAVEIDRDLKPILRDCLQPYRDRVTLLFEDVLTGKHRVNPLVWSALQDASGLEPQADRDPGTVSHPSCEQPFQLIANLPYNIASPLLINLLTDPTRLTMAGGVIMVQHEVAQRLLAGPGTKDYGSLSVIVGATCVMELISFVPPTCFWPRPAVESAVVRFHRRDTPLTRDLPTLQRTLHQLFTQRRKQIGSILGRDRRWPTGVDPSARPEQLTVEQIILLAESDR